jgi:hypothetical protein
MMSREYSVRVLRCAANAQVACSSSVVSWKRSFSEGWIAQRGLTLVLPGSRSDCCHRRDAASPHRALVCDAVHCLCFLRPPQEDVGIEEL